MKKWNQNSFSLKNQGQHISKIKTFLNILKNRKNKRRIEIINMSCCPCPFTIYHFIALQPSLHRQLLLYCPCCCHIDCIHHICHIYRICRKVPDLLPCQISVAVPTAIIETVDTTGRESGSKRRNCGSANLEMIIRYK